MYSRRGLPCVFVPCVFVPCVFVPSVAGVVEIDGVWVGVCVGCGDVNFASVELLLSRPLLSFSPTSCDD